MAPDPIGYRALLVDRKPTQVFKRLGLEYHLAFQRRNCRRNKRLSPVGLFPPYVGLTNLSPIQGMQATTNLPGTFYTRTKHADS